MNRKQIVDDFLSNKRTETVPMSFWYHFVSFHDHYMGLESEEVKHKVHDGQKNTINRLDPDFLKIMSDGYFGHPSVWENKIETIEDLKKVKSVGPEHPWIKEQVAYVKEMCEGVDDRYTFYNIFSPLQYIRLKFEEYDEDFSKFTRLFFEDKEVMMNAAREIEKDIKILVDKIFEETSVDGIYYSVQCVQDTRADEEFHKEYVAKSDLSLLNHICTHTDRVLLHICGYGNYKNNLSYYKDYPVSAYNWAVYSENIDLAEGKKILNNKPVFGGFDNKEGTLLYSGTYDELKKHVYSILDKAGLDGVALGADCTILDTIDPKQIKMLQEIAAEYIKEH